MADTSVDQRSEAAPSPEFDQLVELSRRIAQRHAAQSQPAPRRWLVAQLPGAARLRRWHIVVAVVLLLVAVTRLFVLQPFSVTGDSMQGAANDGATVVANRLSYLFGEPSRGDLVVMQQPRDGASGMIIKRVVGLPGETVEMRGCDVVINGVVLDEPYRSDASTASTASGECDVDAAPTLIDDGHVFVLGDMRDRSDDSRYFGTVPFDLIVGRVVFST